MKFEHKIIWITGASSGIGKALAIELSKMNVKLILSSRNETELQKVKIECANSHNIRIIALDLEKYHELPSKVEEAIALFGKIDILINNAGITKDNLMLRMGEDQWDQVIEVNLKSVFNLTKHTIRYMLKARFGSIINMSSVVGVFGNAGQANYAASKAGIIGFTKSIAKELGSRGIRCNAIAPGFIETDMTGELSEEVIKGYTENIPLKRLGSSVDIANTCAFLGSDMGRYISGQTISVCGGLNT